MKEDLNKLSQTLFSDLSTKETFFDKKLIHYTSISNIENILRTNEIWFSNPLLMNDVQELSFGILESRNKIYLDEGLKKSYKTDKNFKTFINTYEDIIEKFEDGDAFDTYLF